MPYTVTFTADTLCDGEIRTTGSTLVVSDETARMLVDLGVATADGLSPQTGSAAAQFSDTFAAKANNLSDLASPSAARASLGLGSSAVEDATAFISSADGLNRANNLSELTSPSTARTNLGLGVASVANYASPMDAIRGFDDTEIVTPRKMMDALLNGNVFRIYGAIGTAATGTGFGASMSNTYGSIASNTAATAGFARYQILNAQYSIGYVQSYSRWQAGGGFGLMFTAINGTAAGNALLRFGQADYGPVAGVTIGDPTYPFVGFKQTCANGNLDLVVHNGATMTVIPAATNLSGTVRVGVTWDGLGNVRALINNTIVVTTDMGPYNNGTVVNPYWFQQLSSDGTHTAAISTYTFQPVLYHGDQA